MIMMTSSNGKQFPRNWPFVREFTGPGEFPTQRPVTRSFDVFNDLRLNKRLSKQPWGWWFETPSWSLWRQCNDSAPLTHCHLVMTYGVIDIVNTVSPVSPGITWINTNLLSIRTLRANLNFKQNTDIFNHKNVFEMSLAKYRPFLPDLNALWVRAS